MIGSLIGWVVVGLVAGFLARMLHPGNDSMGIIATMVLGILGSLLGGAVAYILKLGTSPFEPGGWILATLGAIVLLVLGWFGTKRRAV
ncbi:GlsB/YeaQ/YmgE family stress response membrane protein [Novipirellula sp.]|uniref:GlsB/YeaQ/YmgE family stress response membrane protein n=1 Tax=Novipirellula sp. TaxID=2795430 RepID=UPI0035622F9C